MTTNTELYTHKPGYRVRCSTLFSYHESQYHVPVVAAPSVSFVFISRTTRIVHCSSCNSRSIHQRQRTKESPYSPSLYNAIMTVRCHHHRLLLYNRSVPRSHLQPTHPQWIRCTQILRLRSSRNKIKHTLTGR